MSQLKRYLNIINELKVPEIGLESAKKLMALRDLKLDPTDLSEKQNEEVFNAYFNYKRYKKAPEWTEIQSAMTGSIALQIKENKLDREVVTVLLQMLKKSAYKSHVQYEPTNSYTIKNDAIDNLKVKDYIKTPSIIHKIVNGKVVDGKVVDGNNKIIIDKN